jgi:hypothetical protein
MARVLLLREEYLYLVEFTYNKKSHRLNGMSPLEATFWTRYD